MSRYQIQFHTGSYFHIYQKTNKGRELIPTDKNHDYFLSGIKKVIDPFAVLIAYCILPDHYHLLIRVNEDPKHNRGYPGVCKLLTFHIRQYIRHYSQRVNIVEKSRGKLLGVIPYTETVESVESLKALLAGIHLNPIFHNLTADPGDYLPSSFHELLKTTSNSMPCEEVMRLFGGRDSFIDFHSKPLMWSKNKEPQ